MSGTPAGEKNRFFGTPRNLRLVLRLFYVLCALLLLLDFVVHRYSYFRFEGIFAFYPVLGFGACVLLVLAAKALRKVLMRDEDHYGP